MLMNIKKCVKYENYFFPRFKNDLGVLTRVTLNQSGAIASKIIDLTD